jgi:Pyridoxamine 5'-phosphate oxidase
VSQLPEDAHRLFEGPNHAHLATLLPDGGPHSVPLWVGVEGNRIALLSFPSSRKARNLDRDPRVATSIIDRIGLSRWPWSAGASPSGSTAFEPGQSSTASRRSISDSPIRCAPIGSSVTEVVAAWYPDVGSATAPPRLWRIRWGMCRGRHLGWAAMLKR